MLSTRSSTNFSKKNYILCHFGDEGNAIEKLICLLLINISRRHSFMISITSDDCPQFVSTLWKNLCNQLRIKANLSTVYLPETDSPSEQANQKVENGLRRFCNYMRNNWAKEISII